MKQSALNERQTDRIPLGPQAQTDCNSQIWGDDLFAGLLPILRRASEGEAENESHDSFDAPVHSLLGSQGEDNNARSENCTTSSKDMGINELGCVVRAGANLSQ